ncbi:MAG TPA: rhodanese-like domain-containing protein [Dongiaceae bacterium]|nr:rhodanese-like domain-containing protein [Dongiaceae bacterium]
MNLKYAPFALALLLAFPGTAANAADAPAKPATAQKADPRYTYKTPRLTRAQFDAYLKKPDQLAVIDVRRPDELITNGSFPAFISIQNSDIEKNLAYIPKDRSLVLVSNHAHRAGATGDLLSGKGYKVVGAIGSLDYEEEGGTIARITKPEPVAQVKQ